MGQCGQAREAGTAAYRRLAEEVRGSGLLERRTGREVCRIVLTAGAFVGGWVALATIGGTWAAAMGLAAYVGVVSTQVVFIGHDAGHRQIFRSRRANRVVGLAAGNVLTGLSFGWWVPKHAAHHAHPNHVGRDPDVGPGVIAWTPEEPLLQGPGRRIFVRWQGALLFPLMLAQLLPMRLSSGRWMRRLANRRALFEGGLIAVHAASYLVLTFAILPPVRALAFIGVQQAAFGLYLGCAFAPNHVGMPLVDEASGASFAQRQVVTSRNVTGGPLVTFLLGGLDRQIEHHLFPTMPRSNLRGAQRLVQEHCSVEGWTYQQQSLVSSYQQVVRHLWAVGHGFRPRRVEAAPARTTSPGESRPEGLLVGAPVSTRS